MLYSNRLFSLRKVCTFLYYLMDSIAMFISVIKATARIIARYIAISRIICFVYIVLTWHMLETRFIIRWLSWHYLFLIFYGKRVTTFCTCVCYTVVCFIVMVTLIIVFKHYRLPNFFFLRTTALAGLATISL